MTTWPDADAGLGPGDKAIKGNHSMTKKKGKVGSSFEEFLKEEGTYEETRAIAVKRVLAW